MDAKKALDVYSEFRACLKKIGKRDVLTALEAVKVNLECGELSEDNVGILLARCEQYFSPPPPYQNSSIIWAMKGSHFRKGMSDWKGYGKYFEGHGLCFTDGESLHLARDIKPISQDMIYYHKKTGWIAEIKDDQWPDRVFDFFNSDKFKRASEFSAERAEDKGNLKLVCATVNGKKALFNKRLYDNAISGFKGDYRVYYENVWHGNDIAFIMFESKDRMALIMAISDG